MKRVGALIFPKFELLDLFGPLEMLGVLDDKFDLKLVSETSGPVVSNQQVCANPDVTFADAEPFDILLIPGGRGTRTEVNNPALLDWIRRSSATADYVLSVCTGSILLADAGILDGKRATTNKAAYKRLTEPRPQVHWVPEARWVEDGTVITSSGVSAGMDMTLRFIEILHGKDTAEQVAIWTEYAWHQNPDWDPFAKVHGL